MRQTEELTCNNPACGYSTPGVPGGVNLSIRKCPVCGSDMRSDRE